MRQQEELQQRSGLVEVQVGLFRLTGQFWLQLHDSSPRGSGARPQRHHGGSAETRSQGDAAAGLNPGPPTAAQRVKSLVLAGERAGHARPDGAAPRGHGRPPPDLPAVARIRSGRLPGVAAGVHRRSDGERSRAADPQRCVESVCVCVCQPEQPFSAKLLRSAPAQRSSSSTSSHVLLCLLLHRERPRQELGRGLQTSGSC